MDDTMNNWGGQDLSLAEAAKLLRELEARDGGEEDMSEQRLAAEEEQKRAMKMADILLTGVNKLHDKLKAAKSTGEIRSHLQWFYDDRLPKFMGSFGLTLESSDAMKLLYGIYGEYMNLLPELGRSAKADIHKDKRLEKLVGFFVNFAAALQNVNYYRDWNSVEESVDTLIRVTGVEDEEMIDVNVDIECIQSDIRRKAVDNDSEVDLVDVGRAIDELSGSVLRLDRKPISGTLDRFARGETWLEEMERVAGNWQRVKAKLDLTSVPDEEDSN